jgi:hypothetical protein
MGNINLQETRIIFILNALFVIYLLISLVFSNVILPEGTRDVQNEYLKNRYHIFSNIQNPEKAPAILTQNTIKEIYF